MPPAAEAGLIARHYATAYRDMFEDLLPNLRKARGRHARREIAITGPHLCILATSPASHVRRQRRSGAAFLIYRLQTQAATSAGATWHKPRTDRPTEAKLRI